MAPAAPHGKPRCTPAARSWSWRGRTRAGTHASAPHMAVRAPNHTRIGAGGSPHIGRAGARPRQPARRGAAAPRCGPAPRPRLGRVFGLSTRSKVRVPRAREETRKPCPHSAAGASASRDHKSKPLQSPKTTPLLRPEDSKPLSSPKTTPREGRRLTSLYSLLDAPHRLLSPVRVVWALECSVHSNPGPGAPNWGDSSW